MHLRSLGLEGYLKTKGKARGLQHLLGNPANVNALKKMFDRYFCINATEYLPIFQEYGTIFIAVSRSTRS